MEFTPKKITRYGKKVWHNPITDSMKPEHCLCCNCEVVDCKYSRAFFYLERDKGLSFMVTRCPHFKQAPAEENKNGKKS